MREVPRVTASQEFGLIADCGVDRYGKGIGSWSTPGKTHRQVSLISMEAIRAANGDLAPYIFHPNETRRNIIVEGIDLNALVGKEFRIGEARLQGTKLCDPCQRPAHLANKARANFERAFRDQGGLCASVVEDGMICLADGITDE